MSEPKNPELSKSVVENPQLRPRTSFQCISHPVTLHDRYCQMRENTGRPQIIIHVVRYPIAQLPSSEFLGERITELQDRFPLLHGGVTFEKTSRPVYVQGYTFAPSQLMREVESETDDPIELYRAEMERFSEVLRKHSMNWSLSRVTAGETGFLILALSHLVTDGKGSTLLLRALTCPHSDLPPKEEWEQPTFLDETVSLTPTPRFLVPVVLRELVLPKMPMFIQSMFTQDPPWPGKVSSPLDKPWDILLLELDPDLVASIKAAGSKHGVKTLHPILKTAYLASMWRVFSSPSPMRLATATARNERKAELGHAAITHNYVSSSEWNLVLSGTDGLWDRAREFADRLASPDGLAEGRMKMGLLAHLPDPVVDKTAADYDPDCPTGWEKFFMQRARSANPFMISMDMSNLGRIDLPPGATDEFWGQTATPFSAAYHVNAIGHEAGIRITSTWIEGSSGTRAQSVQVHEVFEAVLRRLGDAKVTVEEITAPRKGDIQ